MSLCELLFKVYFLSHSLGNFITTAEKIRLPDDCTVGYIIEALLEVPLTHTGLFHSHLENLQRLPTDNILQQVRPLNRWASLQMSGNICVIQIYCTFQQLHLKLTLKVCLVLFFAILIAQNNHFLAH